MVRGTAVLARIPVIKFRKGGVGQAGTSAAPAAAAPTASAGQAQQNQPSAAMSTGPIHDFELPLRYRRQPISDEEIAHINGGGIV